MDDVDRLSELARTLIASCARHLGPDDAQQDEDVLAVHEEIAELDHPDMFVQMMVAWVVSAERKAKRALPSEVFRDRSDLRAANLLDHNGGTLLTLRLFETIDLLADPNRPEHELREHLRILTEGYGASATLSLTYIYLTFAVDVADFERSSLEAVLSRWFLDEEVSLNENTD